MYTKYFYKKHEDMAMMDERTGYLPELLTRNAADLYPERYTPEYITTLRGGLEEAAQILNERQILLLVHNYQYPELQELARLAGGYIGDSYGLTMKARNTTHQTIAYASVYFMAETAKILLPDRRVIIPAWAGCSLADGIAVESVRRWRRRNSDGVVVSYINTNADVKALSDYICTSRNAARVVAHARSANPNARILFLPDKYLAAHILRELHLPPDAMDVWQGCCHVHRDLTEMAIETALERHPDAELLVHPECGCTSSCLSRTACGANPEIQFLSTEGMLERARTSAAQEFVVATEAGMVWRLRRDIPGKIFYPVNAIAHCEYMKTITLERMLTMLRDSESPRWEVTVDAETACHARTAIERMAEIS